MLCYYIILSAFRITGESIEEVSWPLTKVDRKDTPLYKAYSWFLRRFGLKAGIDFAHFGLESGMAFEETTGVYEGNCRFTLPYESEMNTRIQNGL